MRVLIAVPVLLLLVLFALSNPQPVQLGLWPTDFTIAPPLSIAMLVAMALSFLAGALVLWMAGFSARARMRRAERARGLLEAQVRELQARTAGAALPPPG